MTKKTMKFARVATSSALGLALAIGGTSVAFAHGAKDHGSSKRHEHALHVEGTISGLSATTPGSLTLTLRDGTSVTYATTASTTYFEGRTSATSAVLTLGENVDATLNATTPTNVDLVRVDLVKFEGKITAITGAAGAATITMTGPKHTTRTVTLNAATTFEMKGQVASFTSLVVGAEIGAMGLSSTNNTMTALSIVVSAPEVTVEHALHVEGTISGLSATTPGSLTLTLRDGTSVTYATTASTTYFEGRTSATSAVLALGENVDATLNATTPTNVDLVRVDLVKFEGKITAITGAAGAATITMTGPKHTTRTVTLNAATTFEMKGQVASFTSLVVGAEIGAMGLSSTNNTMTALSIVVSAPEVTVEHALHVEGTISGLSATTPGSLTLTLRDGTSVTYATTASTTYFEGRTSATSAVLTLGENVDATLNATTPTNVDLVRVDLVKFEGKITAITGAAGAATITMTGPKHTTRTVTLNAATTFEMKGQVASFTSLVVGAEIGAMGLSSTNNTMTALSIVVSAPEGSKHSGKTNHDARRS